jgi:DNA-directed RNA polymerase specialized sigma24 family protein
LQAFNRLVLLHQDEVYNFALRALEALGAESTAAEAADATQAAFLEAYRLLPEYRQEPLDEWMLAAAARECRKRLRQARRSPGWKRAWPVDGQHEDDGCLAAALVDGQGFDYERAARVLGISPARLRRCLAQARQRAAQAKGSRLTA